MKEKTLLLKPTDTTSVFQWEEHSAIQRAAGSLSCSATNFCVCKVGLTAPPTFPRLLRGSTETRNVVITM